MYFKGKGECDFVVQEGTRPAEAWQACWELNRSAEKREMRGLLEAQRELGIKKGAILTYNQEGTRKFEGETLEVVPVWKWLLGSPAEKLG
jgi:hypothetical protein